MRSQVVEKFHQRLDVPRRDNIPYVGKAASRETLADLLVELRYFHGIYIGQQDEYFRLLREKQLRPVCLTDRNLATKYDNHSQRFIYFNHHTDFDEFMIDLITWVPKVKSGGIVAGHNFCHWHNDIVIAVEAYTRGNNIPVWYLTQDKVPSWIWIR